MSRRFIVSVVISRMKCSCCGVKFDDHGHDRDPESKKKRERETSHLGLIGQIPKNVSPTQHRRSTAAWGRPLEKNQMRILPRKSGQVAKENFSHRRASLTSSNEKKRNGHEHTNSQIRMQSKQRKQDKEIRNTLWIHHT